MRSTFLHLKGCTKSEVEDLIADLSSEDVQLGFYDDYLTEYEPEDIRSLKNKLGIFPPDLTIIANLSGRITGYDESLALAKVFLSRYDGVAQDDSDSLWTLEQLLADHTSDGFYFMEDTRRHKGLL